MTTITVTAFRWVPPFAQGLVRDLRVRWALEEAGLPYDTRLIGPEAQTSAAYLAQQPFGQVPVYQEDALTLFESGAIVMHIATRSEALLPAEPAARARTLTWAFAALNSVEPAIGQLVDIDLFHAEEPWAPQARPVAVQAVQQRLGRLADWLSGRAYLEDRFTAADLLMTTVLQILRETDLVSSVPVLRDYQHRCEDRPGYHRALADQLAPFREHAPPQS